MDRSSYKGGIAIVLLLLLSALAAAGCGGSSDAAGTGADQSTGTASALTKAQLIAQGDAICEKGEDKFAADIKAFSQKAAGSKPLTNAQENEALQAVFIPSLQAQADELAQLGVPDGDEAEVNAIVKGLQEEMAEAETKPAGLIKSLAKLSLLAEKYGFKVCLNSF